MEEALLYLRVNRWASLLPCTPLPVQHTNYPKGHTSKSSTIKMHNEICLSLMNVRFTKPALDRQKPNLRGIMCSFERNICAEERVSESLPAHLLRAFLKVFATGWLWTWTSFQIITFIKKWNCKTSLRIYLTLEREKKSIQKHVEMLPS